MGKFIGIYGGSFDPIHIGHLNLATEILEAHHLDEVWFCPAERNPLKKEQAPVGASHRLNMVRLAIEEEPRFKVSEIEMNRAGLSYTVDTLNELNLLQKDKEDPDSFALILGEDAARDFFQWHQAEAIVDSVKLLIGSRKNEINTIEGFQGSHAIVNALNNGLTKTRIMEISSKEIRERLLNKKYCYHLLPGKVMDYIITNHLYCDPLKTSGARFL